MCQPQGREPDQQGAVLLAVACYMLQERRGKGWERWHFSCTYFAATRFALASPDCPLETETLWHQDWLK